MSLSQLCTAKVACTNLHFAMARDEQKQNASAISTVEVLQIDTIESVMTPGKIK